MAISTADRIAPQRPVLQALRATDPRVDPAFLIRCDPQPGKESGAAILLLPGGNYDNCNLGFPLQVANWLTGLGLVVFVLRYRLRSEGHYWPAQQEDCQDGLRFIHNFVHQDSRLTAGAVGVLGFSSGGHLASVAATMFPNDIRPNFHILVYATTNVETPPWWPWRARHGFPGPEFNTFDKVTRATPPLFAAVSKEDDVTTYEDNTLPYVEACWRAGVDAVCIFESMGGHGHGMVDAWTKPCEEWLKANNWAV